MKGRRLEGLTGPATVVGKDHEQTALVPQKHMKLTCNRGNPIARRVSSTRVDEQESGREQGVRARLKVVRAALGIISRVSNPMSYEKRPGDDWGRISRNEMQTHM